MSENKSIKVLVSGFDGKMGKNIRELILKKPGWQVTAGFGRLCNFIVPMPTERGVVPIASNYEQLEKLYTVELTRPNVIFEFSSAEATAVVLEFAYDYKIPIVIGTTALGNDVQTAINEYSQYIPIFQASNFSSQMYLLEEVIKIVAPKLWATSDVEIEERHHKDKADAPSGTAKHLAQVIADAVGAPLNMAYGREGKREKGEIGIAALRGGSIDGDHEIGFYGEYEIFKLHHEVRSKLVFAEGALDAAEFLLGQPAGLYGLSDIFDL